MGGTNPRGPQQAAPGRPMAPAPAPEAPKVPAPAPGPLDGVQAPEKPVPPPEAVVTAPEAPAPVPEAAAPVAEPADDTVGLELADAATVIVTGAHRIEADVAAVRSTLSAAVDDADGGCHLLVSALHSAHVRADELFNAIRHAESLVGEGAHRLAADLARIRALLS